jgi:hypothetical protein
MEHCHHPYPESDVNICAGQIETSYPDNEYTHLLLPEKGKAALEPAYRAISKC